MIGTNGKREKGRERKRESGKSVQATELDDDDDDDDDDIYHK